MAHRAAGSPDSAEFLDPRTADIPSFDDLWSADAWLATVIDHAPVAILLKDTDARVVKANPAFERMVGAGRDELVGQCIDGRYSDHWREKSIAEDALVLQHGRTIETEASDIVEGSDASYRIVKVPVRDASGEIIGLAEFAADTTALRRTETRLDQARRMGAIGQITGGVAHDFNNMLQIILGNLDLMDERMDEADETHGLIGPAIAAAERGAELTQRLLGFARREEPHPRDVDLGELAGNLKDLLQTALGESVAVEISAAPGLGQCRLDAGQFQTALLNLAVNARDAMPRGGRFGVTIENARVDGPADRPDGPAPGDYVKTVVEDDGAGMPAEVAARAFEPFFTTKGAGRAPGLGLSMVRELVEQSGGHVALASEPDEGTRLEIWLPRIAPADPAFEAAAETQPGVTRPAHILLVEDDPDVHLLAEQMLKSLNHDVTGVHDGSAAIEMLGRSDEFDLLLTDVVLRGGMSGVQIAEQVRERSPATRVLFMSGYNEEAISDRDPGAAGAVMITKPFRKQELADAIDQALSQGSD